MKRTERLFAAFAFLGLALSLLVHLSALMGIDVQAKVPYVWLLHGGALLVFIPFVFLISKALPRRPSMAQMRAVFPDWALLLMAAATVYVAINFFLFLQTGQGGTPELVDGKFVLQVRGNVLKELSESDYVRLRANQVRGFSGHWLLFYFAPLMYFVFRKKPVVDV